MKTLFCAFVLSASFGTAAAQIAVPDHVAGDPQAVVEAVNKAWIEAYVAGDVEALVRMYAPDAAILSTGGVVLEDHDSIRNFFSLVTDTRSRNLVVKKSAVRDYGDVVVQSATWHFEAILWEGREIEGSGRTTTVVRRTPEGWYIIGYHPAFDRPPE